MVRSVPETENVTAWRSVAVTVPIAVWFSSTVKEALDVITGLLSLILVTEI